jgi:hypothetical protein
MKSQYTLSKWLGDELMTDGEVNTRTRTVMVMDGQQETE